MQYADLTQQQKDALQSLVNAVRSFAANLAQLSNLGIGISADYNGGLSDVINSLDNGATIPSSSGLAGAQDVSKADVINFIGYAINISDVTNNTGGGGYNTNFHRALAVKLAGIINTVGI